MVQASINSVYILESLPEGERKTGKEIYDDVVYRYAEIYKSDTPFLHQFFSFNSKAKFIDILKFINSVTTNLNPGLLLHFETHGSKNGIHLADESMISCQELQKYLIDINVSLENQ